MELRIAGIVDDSATTAKIVAKATATALPSSLRDVPTPVPAAKIWKPGILPGGASSIRTTSSLKF